MKNRAMSTIKAVLKLIVKALVLLISPFYYLIKMSSQNKFNPFVNNVLSFLLYYYGRVVEQVHWYEKAVEIYTFSREIGKVEIVNSMVVFESYEGRSYACSPKAIYEYMLSDTKYENYTFVWVFRNPEKHLHLLKNNNIKLVHYKSWQALKHYRKAKYWIVNFRLPFSVIKKPDQVMVQCWHGTPFKKIGLDIVVDRKGTKYPTSELYFQYEHDTRNYSYFLSPSNFATEKFISAFNLTNQNNNCTILEKGYPRNDRLSNYSNEEIQSLKAKFNIPADKKVILYAPTWRDNQFNKGTGYTLEYNIDFSKLRTQLSQDIILLIRSHYLIKQRQLTDDLKRFVIDVSKVDDVNDLLIISDILITDYSSIFFDYAILKRPMLFYMYDILTYKNNLRDLYLDLKELPGDIVYTQSELTNKITETLKTPTLYDEKISEFNQTYNYLEDGKASERVAKTVFKNC